MASRTRKSSRTRSTGKTSNRSRAGATTRRWSRQVTETSDAMTLEPGVFRMRSPRAIARSVKRSAERSTRRKSPPYRSAMSMLTFYVNRGGKNLSPAQKQCLTQAKEELRRLYGRQPSRTAARPRRAGRT
jgi:hypothetical protein